MAGGEGKGEEGEVKEEVAGGEGEEGEVKEEG